MEKMAKYGDFPCFFLRKLKTFLITTKEVQNQGSYFVPQSLSHFPDLDCFCCNQECFELTEEKTEEKTVEITIFGHFFHFCFPRLNKFLIIKKTGQNKQCLNNFVRHSVSIFLA